MLKYLLWLQLIKYGNIDAKGGNGIKRNPMRLLYTLHPKDYKISWHIKDYNWRDRSAKADVPHCPRTFLHLPIIYS